MRIIRTIQAWVGMSLAAVSTAMAAPLALLQDPASPVKVEVHTTESHTVWYTNPVWLAIGGIALVIVIMLIVMAARGKDSSTTVVR